MRLRREILTIVLRPCTTRHKFQLRTVRGFFCPAGADHKEAQDGCPNGQLWLAAFIRAVYCEIQT